MDKTVRSDTTPSRRGAHEINNLTGYVHSNSDVLQGYSTAIEDLQPYAGSDETPPEQKDRPGQTVSTPDLSCAYA